MVFSIGTGYALTKKDDGDIRSQNNKPVVMSSKDKTLDLDTFVHLKEFVTTMLLCYTLYTLFYY